MQHFGLLGAATNPCSLCCKNLQKPVITMDRSHEEACVLSEGPAQLTAVTTNQRWWPSHLGIQNSDRQVWTVRVFCSCIRDYIPPDTGVVSQSLK